MRHREHELVEQARLQAASKEAWADYMRRRHLMEGSYAQSANCHGFKRARWRRLWRQQIQDWIIAACQNAKILARALHSDPITVENVSAVCFAAQSVCAALFDRSNAHFARHSNDSASQGATSIESTNSPSHSTDRPFRQQAPAT